MATGILAMLAKPKGKGGSKGPPAPMGDEPAASGGGDEVASSLREMFDLLQAGDDDGAALAFRRAYESCAGGGDEPELDLGDEAAESDNDLDL